MLGRNVKSATLRAPLYGGRTRMTTGQNPLAGVPLRCLIGGDGAGEGKDGELIMAPYDATVAPRRGYSAKYLNLYREDGEPPAYGTLSTAPHDRARLSRGRARPGRRRLLAKSR